MSELIAAHLAHLRAGTYSRHTITDRGELLHRMDAELPWGLDEANTEELADWLAGPSDPSSQWSAWTRYTYYTHVTGFYRWATEHGHLYQDPAVSLPRPRTPRCVPKPIPHGELELLLAQAREPYRLWIVIMARAGLRVGDLAGLTREEITEEQMLIHGKGGKIRWVPTDQYIWRSVRELPPGPIARRISDGQPADAAYLSRAIAKYFRSFGVDRSAHSLRHWFASTLLDEGVDIAVISELLGHASIQTTLGYTLISSGKRRQAVTALPTVQVTC